MLKFLLISAFISLILGIPVDESSKNVVQQEVVDEEKLTVLSRKPAMKMRLTKKGMDYLNEKAVDAFNKRMKCMKFEEKMVETTSMTNTTMVTYEPMKFTYSMIPKTSMIMWQGLGGQMTMEGDWDMKVENASLGTIEETGTFKVIMKGFNFTMMMVEGMKSAKPSMHMDMCMVTVDSMQVDFNCSEKARQFIQDDTMMAFWNETMNSTICLMMTKAVENMNGVMQSFKTVMPVGQSPFQVEYSMLATPKLELNACETTHMAEITCNNTDVTILPTPISSINDMDDKSMMIMQFSDYMMNSMADSAFRMGMMNMTVSNETATTPDMVMMLRTTCEEDQTCMGSISNDFQSKFPNATVRLQIHATKPMFFETKPWGMRAYTQSVITVYCNDDEELMRMDVTGRVEIKPVVVENIMQMNATLTHMKVTIVKSNVENVDVGKVEKLTESGLLSDKPFFIEMFERHLAEGIPMPQMDGVTMMEPRMIMGDRSMAVVFDISI